MILVRSVAGSGQSRRNGHGLARREGRERLGQRHWQRDQ